LEDGSRWIQDKQIKQFPKDGRFQKVGGVGGLEALDMTKASERTDSALAIYNLDCAVVIAVAVVLMVQMAIDQIVDMITVGNRRVAAVRTMDMIRTMSRASVPTGACGRIL
jgi:hypothetical protein